MLSTVVDKDLASPDEEIAAVDAMPGDGDHPRPSDSRPLRLFLHVGPALIG